VKTNFLCNLGYGDPGTLQPRLPRLAFTEACSRREKESSTSKTRLADPGGAGGSLSPWRPLRTPIFRNLLIADVLSDIGTFMQTVGAAWLMVSLDAGSPWNHWRMPAIVEDVRPDLDEGPMLVTVEYRVKRDQLRDFLRAIHEYGRVRRRDGAFRWGIYRDLEDADRYVETFLVSSWAEHLRQHERTTNADRKVEARLKVCVIREPDVRHLVATEEGSVE